jgi:ubiquinone/menaquinone biosynthesis C-methylase UbiE
MSVSVGQYTNIDDTADASWFISFSDSVNAIPEYGVVRQSLITQLGPLEGRHVLDVGCGPGDDTREVAELVGPSGRVVGVDRSEGMLAEARRRGGAVEFLQGDVYALPFEDETFDRVRLKLVRMHLPELDAADDELVRVLRPGGRIAVFDLDFETLAVDHPDQALTRAVHPYWVDQHKQGWCGRQTRRQFLTRGMKDVTVVPHTMQMEFGMYVRASEAAIAEAVTAGVLDSAEDWYGPLEEADRSGLFFGTLTGYVVAATR